MEAATRKWKSCGTKKKKERKKNCNFFSDCRDNRWFENHGFFYYKEEKNRKFIERQSCGRRGWSRRGSWSSRDTTRSTKVDNPSANIFTPWGGVQSKCSHCPVSLAAVPTAYCYPSRGWGSDLINRIQDCGTLVHVHLPELTRFRNSRKRTFAYSLNSPKPPCITVV